MDSNSKSKQKLDRSAWLVLGISLFLIAINIFQLAYRYTLPTDGWFFAVEGESFTDTQVIARQNLVGVQSGISEGDRLLKIGEYLPEDSPTDSMVDYRPAPESWEVGGTLSYTIEHSGEQQVVSVPIVHWTLQTLIRRNFLDPVGLVSNLTSLAMFGLGLFVFLKRPQDWAARVFLFFSAVSLSTNISGMLPDFPSTTFNLLAAIFSSLMSYWIWGILLTPTLFVFTLVFPRPKDTVRRYPWLLLLPYTVIWLLVLVFGPRPEAGWGVSMAYFILSAISILHSVIVFKDPVSRAQLKWPIGGILFAALAYLPMYMLVFGLIDPPGDWFVRLANFLTQLAFPVFIASLAIAILRYRLWDIDVIIRRTLIYLALTVTLALVFLGAVTLLQAVFSAVSGQRSAVATVISTLLIAALFSPLLRRIQGDIDRRFYRKKYNAEQAIERFAATARQETDIEALSAELLAVVSETMQPESVTLWLKPIIKKRPQ